MKISFKLTAIGCNFKLGQIWGINVENVKFRLRHCVNYFTKKGPLSIKPKNG
jgi:hypothetical protein